jgi:hypothetical protein
VTDHRALAQQLRAEAEALEQRARELRAAADALEGTLTRPRTSTTHIDDVTPEQIARRGRAIARSRAAGRPTLEALASRWGSLRRAATALGVSPSALSGYVRGVWPCPRGLAEAVERETGLRADGRTWPRGVVE